nr:protein krueppel-like [Penaeus vannamei]
MRIHKKEQPYMCFACGREFSHLSHLHRHERIHTGERPHKCPYCPKKFIQLVTLKIHLKKHEKLAPEELKPADEGLRGKEEVVSTWA